MHDYLSSESEYTVAEFLERSTVTWRPSTTVVSTTPDQVVNAGNIYQCITSGTTANAETVIRSKLTFRGALLARYKAILSQRIANQTVYIGFYDETTPSAPKSR